MSPKDIKVLLDAINETKVKFTKSETLLMSLATRAVRQDRWLHSKDAWDLQALYRKSQGSTI